MKPLPETWDQDLSEDGVVDAVRAYKERWEKRSGTIPDEESAVNLQNYYFNCIQDSDNNLMGLLEGLEDLGMEGGRSIDAVTSFSPNDFNTPETYEELTAHNDLELYDLENDPDETHNLAQDPEYKDLVMEMNGLLNQLIEEEIGVDDGSEIEKVKQKFAELGPELKNLVG